MHYSLNTRLKHYTPTQILIVTFSYPCSVAVKKQD